jgi:hypothetical protein
MAKRHTLAFDVSPLLVVKVHRLEPISAETQVSQKELEIMLNLLIVIVVVVAASLAAAAISIFVLRCLFWLMTAANNRIEVPRNEAADELAEARA